jgi:hypothetical protein
MFENVILGTLFGLNVLLWIILLAGWYVSKYIAKDHPYDGTYY